MVCEHNLIPDRVDRVDSQTVAQIVSKESIDVLKLNRNTDFRIRR